MFHISKIVAKYKKNTCTVCICNVRFENFLNHTSYFKVGSQLTMVGLSLVKSAPPLPYSMQFGLETAKKKGRGSGAWLNF